LQRAVIFLKAEFAMPDPSSSQSKPPDEVLANLLSTAQTLSATEHLTPTAQKTLADLVSELGKALTSGKASSEEVGRLAESVALLNQAISDQENREHSKWAARERLQESIYLTEAKHPVLAGLAQQFLNILAELGI
jgi:hypothetical protein